MTYYQLQSKLITLVPVAILISLLNSSHFVECAEAEGKAIYTSPTHNPISTYFKEQKNKLRPYFAKRPAGGATGGLDLSDLYPEEELIVHDDTQSAHSSYYDGGGGSPAPSPYHDNLSSYPNPSQEDHHSNFLNLNPYDMASSSSPSSSSASLDGHAESSNAMYSVVDPHSYGLSAPYSGNPGGYFNGGDPLQATQYIRPPSFHGPGMPGSGSGGYYGGGGGHHDNSIYSQPPSNPGYYGNSGASSPPASSSPHHHHVSPPASNADKSNDNHGASSNQVDTPSNNYPYPAGGGGSSTSSGSNGEYQSGLIMDDDMLIDMEDNHPQISPPDYSPYDYQAPGDGGDGDELFAAPGAPDAAAGAAGGGGAGSSGTAAAATSDTSSQTAPENPLNFLNLVGTDFQPGRLVNIFFGLFIMLFMIIFHGYALWILGIAYLPGTRSLGSSEWEMNWDKVNEACELVLDSLEYWENKLEEK